MKIDLYACSRCGLIFAWKELPKHCPHCRREYSDPPVIVPAAMSVEIRNVQVMGRPAPNPIPSHFNLGEWCEHGNLARTICAECNQVS